MLEPQDNASQSTLTMGFPNRDSHNIDSENVNHQNVGIRIANIRNVIKHERYSSNKRVVIARAALEMSFDDMAAHMGVNMGSQQRRVVHTAIPRQDMGDVTRHDMGHILHDNVDARYELGSRVSSRAHQETKSVKQ